MIPTLLAAGATCYNRVLDTDLHSQFTASLLEFSSSVSALRERIASACDGLSEVHPLAVRRLALSMATMVLLSVVTVEPALAQSNPVCSDDSGTLVDMIEGFVQLTTALGVMGLLVVWQADSLMEMFTLNHEQQASLKQHKRSALKSAVVLVLLGPLFTLMGSSMDLPIAECVDLIPF